MLPAPRELTYMERLVLDLSKLAGDAFQNFKTDLENMEKKFGSAVVKNVPR